MIFLVIFLRVVFCRGDLCWLAVLKQIHMAMGQNRMGTFLGLVTTPRSSLFKRLFGSSPGYRGFDPLPYCVRILCDVYTQLMRITTATYNRQAILKATVDKHTS